MAATMGFPFTAAQWKELERQATIYKYMVASVPVPYELLLPITQNHSPSLLRTSTKQDLEPGRCKRTDGKKWRCSRDVAPNQKYCERHVHRGRPRSRKHVEPTATSLVNNNNNNKKIRLPNTPHSNPCKVLGSTFLPSATDTPLFLDNTHSKIVDSNRGLDWSMEGGSEQQWQQIMQTSHHSVFNHDFGEDPALNLMSFTDFGTCHDYLCSRKDLIDADKNKVIEDAPISSLSASALDLSMAMALGGGGEFCGIQRGLCVNPGGPLAEVLRPSVPEPYPTGDSVSPPATTISSPSGVLQRTMLSLSDGSAGNSPTRDIVAFQWFT